jgi:NAD(P)-dependent dehydrogenase (short-subunit alcohol dehydrogenase family)
MAADGDPLFSVAGKNVLVTGGSRGVGYMVASGLLDRGARVTISARKAEPLQRAADALQERGECDAVVADLSRPDGVASLVAAVRARGEPLDVLVNNAGATWGDPLESFPVDGWDKVMDTNVRGVFLLTAGLLPELRAAADRDGPARVINVGSIHGLAPPADIDNFPYTASKAAVHMLTRHLARFLAPQITVNALAPGSFSSKMTAHLLDNADKHAEIVAATPLGRIGEADDIVGAAVFLASRAGAFMTGTVTVVDGGVSGC